jgi:CheY-like chemotaxis protein
MTRILIAGDHDVVRAGLRTILEQQEGWEVVGEAADGRAAVTQALATKPDVVVIDYALPLLNGIEATRQIRSRVPEAKFSSSPCTTPMRCCGTRLCQPIRFRNSPAATSAYAPNGHAD